MEAKFNFNHLNIIDLYKYSFIDRIFIKLQTRALGSRIDRLFILLPVLINMNLSDKYKAVDNTKMFLIDTIEPKNLALKVYDRVILRLFDYKKDNNLFIQDRQKSFDILCQNIQLYSIVDRILSDEEQKSILREIIKKQYDESYSIDDNTKNILSFQEQHYL
ncbi:hypothetical protein [Helicobacter sp. MIT 14-3879]|uniref:hypothetical protein n=1 Tax=Helicobacter sp. MIT 14-3879 TaxID=2040649 RepID=UPI000E1F962F|nr:hypothetical protein [Helicobacter sp. MIT 14-3879]RDU65121.1 hypothetical protein CQA44_02065 [Helicobacter sp. MIT 14-3879]